MPAPDISPWPWEADDLGEQANVTVVRDSAGYVIGAIYGRNFPTAQVAATGPEIANAAARLISAHKRGLAAQSFKELDAASRERLQALEDLEEALKKAGWEV